jgi:hypothetical protein
VELALFISGCSLKIGYAQAVGASRRVFELLDRTPKQRPAGDATPAGSPEGGEIIFDHVWSVSSPSPQCCAEQGRSMHAFPGSCARSCLVQTNLQASL